MIDKLLGLLKDRNLILYTLIGLCGVAIDFAIYFILIRLKIPPTIASFISVSIAIVNNFVLNAYFNFKRKDHMLYRFASFYIIGATGALLSALFIYLFHDKFGAGALVAKGISVPFIVAFQYWFNKNASFAVNHRQAPVKQLSVFLICVIVVTIYTTLAPFGQFVDEYDNLLGAQFISQHAGILYKDYFSHHMPLTYFSAVPFFILFGTKLIAIKTAIGGCAAIWLLVISRHILRKYGLAFFGMFVLLMTLSQVPNTSNHLLAETLISYATLHALVLFLTRDQRRNIYRELCTYGLLASIPILSALSYAPLSLTIYGLALYRLYESKAAKSLLRLLPALAISTLPYVALVAYLVFNHDVAEFRQQAINFNTLYYSQFTPDAPLSLWDSILVIPQNVFGDLYHALTFHIDSPITSVLVFFGSATLLLNLALLYKQRRFALFAAFVALCLFGASRNGLTPLFNGTGDSRNSFIIFPIMVIISLYGLLVNRSHNEVPGSDLTRISRIVSTLFIALCFAFTINSTASAYRQVNKIGDYATLDPHLQTSSPASIVNLINEDSDYYWIAPLDFGSQLHITSHHTGIYRFYAPWHAVCPECVTAITNDIHAKRPNVIFISRDYDIWGRKVKMYMRPLFDSFKTDYYQVGDDRLNNFYFLKAQQTEIYSKLTAAGFDGQAMPGDPTL